MSQAQIYDTMTKWMDERLKENKNIDSRIVFSDEAKGTIAGIGEEWIVFSSSALSLDRTLVNYQITVTCKPGNCLVELEKSVLLIVKQKNIKPKNGLLINMRSIKLRLN